MCPSRCSSRPNRNSISSLQTAADSEAAKIQLYDYYTLLQFQIKLYRRAELQINLKGVDGLILLTYNSGKIRK
jgi:hypothetical protein